MKKTILFSCLLLCQPVFAHDSNKTPELWSSFKKLNKSSEACHIQSGFELEQLGVSSLVSNKYGLYGVFRKNRVVVKCIDQGQRSILWVAVAGYDRDSAEYLRNIITRKIE